MVIALDMDGTIDALPTFFSSFVRDMQHERNKVGILTNRLTSERKEIEKKLDGYKIKPDFYIDKPDEYSKIPPGIFKAIACNKLGINILIDDFQKGNPQMLKDFKEHNKDTIVLTLWQN